MRRVRLDAFPDSPRDNRGEAFSSDLTDMADVSVEQVAPEQFAAQADDIVATIQNGIDQAKRNGTPMREAVMQARQSAHEAYVEQEENPELRRFSELLFSVPRIVENARQLRLLEEQASQGLVAESKRDEFRARTRQGVEDNHALREVVRESSRSIGKEMLIRWLERMGDPTGSVMKQRVTSVAAEIATAKALESLPEVRSVAFGSVEDDLRGKDMFVLTRDGRAVPVDVKYGKFGDGVKKASGGRIEIGIDTRNLYGFELRPEKQHDLLQSFRRAARLNDRYRGR